MSRLPLPATAPSPDRLAVRCDAPVHARLLVVDDEEKIRLMLTRYLRSRGYEVRTAESAEEALDVLAREPHELVLCDVCMSGMSGIAMVPEVLRLDRDAAVVMLTGVNDAPTAAEVLSTGAYDYLVKPVELDRLSAAVERALARRTRLMEQRRVERLIREEVALRTEELEQEQAALRALTVNVAETLISAMEAKDVYLRGHSQRVAELAASIAEELGLDPDTVEHVRLAGRVHDVGKIGIREEVLHTPGRLTPEEFAHVKEHVRIGVEILTPLRHLGPVINYVHDHHEHWDGSGYPRGLRGADISLGGRILAAADAFDALTSRRPYRDPMVVPETLTYMGTLSGALLDPEVYAALRSVVLRGKSISLTFVDDVHA